MLFVGRVAHYSRGLFGSSFRIGLIKYYKVPNGAKSRKYDSLLTLPSKTGSGQKSKILVESRKWAFRLYLQSVPELEIWTFHVQAFISYRKLQMCRNFRSADVLHIIYNIWAGYYLGNLLSRQTDARAEKPRLAEAQTVEPLQTFKQYMIIY